MEMPILPLKVKEKFRKNFYEIQAWAVNELVCGIDEVGRGCLAGPLVTAAVILPAHKTHPLLKDSKLLSVQDREKAYKWIIKNCWQSVGIVHHRLVDEHNIWHATLLAMKRALVNLLAHAPHPRAILVDAMPLNLFDTSFCHIPVYHFIEGERKSSSIAAASIVAKVRRDALMKRFDILFPGYQLGQHKGYSTPGHKLILRERKQESLIHRQTFLKNLEKGEVLNDPTAGEQQSLC